MNWKKYWNENASHNKDDAVEQVQRKDIKSSFLTANHIIRSLEIQRDDVVLDVCCGNGLLTQQIAKKCHDITGVDQSEELIAIAKQEFKEMNCRYILGSALELENVLSSKFDKIYLQFSFQYFDKKGEGEKVIRQLLKCLKPSGKIFIGDITNKSKLAVFYDTPIKKLRLLKGKILRKNVMGKFWKPSELDVICNRLNVKGTHLNQPNELPYAHYRFDYLIEN